MTIEDLRPFENFEGLSDEQLQWLIDHGKVIELEPGATLFKMGDQADRMWVMVEGKVQVVIERNGQRMLFLTRKPGDVTGLLPYSRMKTSPAWGYAVEAVRVLEIHQSDFAEMLYVAPAFGKRLVEFMSDRVRETARLDQQREKMMALGKMAAGLAHELNNPAAAMRRSADQLKGRFRKLPSLISRVTNDCLDPDQLDAVHALLTHPQDDPDQLTTLERSEREDEIADWLDDHEVEESWILSEALIEAGLTIEALDTLADQLPDDALPDVLPYVEVMLTVERMLEEMASASNRISDLIAAVKAYSHMDQAPDRQMADVHRGLDDTLKILAHKLKQKSITVEREYQPDAPEVSIYVSELNQVWTNLIDNALDAMSEGGTLRVETGVEGSHLLVRIIDDGPGIPEEIRERIFEPFFTTKGVGEGTGLGLDIVQRIIRQHAAMLAVDSEPGRTAFSIGLPLSVKTP